MPAPASAMVARASSSCWRQSQRREWKTSPVRHWEWMRTMGGGAGDRTSPMTRATGVSTRLAGAGMPSLQDSGAACMPSKPRMRKCPQRVGRSASATFLTLLKVMERLYGSVCIEIGFGWSGFRCGWLPGERQQQVLRFAKDDNWVGEERGAGAGGGGGGDVL